MLHTIDHSSRFGNSSWRSSTLAVAIALALVAALMSPLLASASDDVLDGIVPFAVSGSADDFRTVDPSGDLESRTLSDDYVRRAAQEGALVDAAEVLVAETPSGLKIATTGQIELTSYDHSVEIVTTAGGEAVDESFRVGSTVSEAPVWNDGTEVPLGPGSISLQGITGNKCFTARGDRFYNIMTWCYNKSWLDNGNGRKSLGQSDDDGSNWEDFYAYKRWATVQPDKTPLRDYFILQAHVFSWPTWNTINSRDSRLLDWTPTNGDCSQDTTLSAPIGNITWGTTVCSGGTDISIASQDGRMKHYYDCTICSGGTKYVGFHVGVAVKQGTVPYWNDDNYAKFRQEFSTNFDTIDA